MDDLVEQFEWYADWASDVSPLYHRLAQATAGEPELLDIAAETPAGQPGPNSMFAAVHSLLLAGADHSLARFYPTCGGERIDELDADPVPEFRAFCRARERRLREVVATRRVQTNAVGRSALLVPAFEHVARSVGTRSLALIEVGSSAGRNLFWDRYGYAFDHELREAVETVGDPDADVRIDAAVRGDGDPPLPTDVPSVPYRAGVDLNPLDVTDPADARWLRALIPPEQRDRHRRLDAAIEAAGEDRPRVIEGDAVEALPELVADAPDAPLVVFSTYVLYQFDDDTLAALRETLTKCSRKRPVYWLSNDPDGPDGPAYYRLVAFEDGEEVERERLAEFEAHGDWLRWLAE